MATPTCSTTCDSDLPEVKFDQCNPQADFSEIRRIFMAKATAASFTNWANASEWNARISADSVVGDDYIRALTVIGDKPVPTAVSKDLSNGRKKVIGKDHVINFLIDDITDENYEFMRALECGGQYKFWYETEGGHMYGGNDGILANAKLDSQLNRGREEIGALIGVLDYRAKFTEERTVSPIYDGNNSPVVTPTFDTTLTFAGATSDVDQGVTGTVPATDADLMFEFKAISPRVGSPMTMTVKVATVTKITVDFPSDYVGEYFKFTDASDVEHSGNFVNGTIDF